MLKALEVVIPTKTIETVDCGPFRLNLVRGQQRNDQSPMWHVDLWRHYREIQRTAFSDEDMARAVFTTLADGLPVRVARIAHRLDK